MWKTCPQRLDERKTELADAACYRGTQGPRVPSKRPRHSSLSFIKVPSFFPSHIHAAGTTAVHRATAGSSSRRCSMLLRHRHILQVLHCPHSPPLRRTATSMRVASVPVPRANHLRFKQVQANSNPVVVICQRACSSAGHLTRLQNIRITGHSPPYCACTIKKEQANSGSLPPHTAPRPYNVYAAGGRPTAAHEQCNQLMAKALISSSGAPWTLLGSAYRSVQDG